MKSLYPWLSTLWQHCEAIDKPCGLLLSGAPHTGLDRFVIFMLQEKWGIFDPSNHPDIMFIEGGDKSIGIDLVRDLVSFTQIKPTRLSFKLVIIHPMDALTIAAQQSFLKTLEESLVPTYFFMLCYNMNRVLPTIKSRSTCMSMGEISSDAILQYAKQLGLSFDEHDLNIAQYAPLYHERPDYPSFKKVFSESLDICHSDQAWSSKSVTWDKISPEIQMNAMLLAIAAALKRNPMSEVLHRYYSTMIEVARLREMNPNINLAMHLDAVRVNNAC